MELYIFNYCHSLNATEINQFITQIQYFMNLKRFINISKVVYTVRMYVNNVFFSVYTTKSI